MKLESTGLFLTGGGARAAYQVGVLKAIAEFKGLDQERRVPFSQISGVSAGAINAAALASAKDSFAIGTQNLVEIWSNLLPENVYSTDIYAMGKIAGQWIRDLSFGAVLKNRKASELLSTTPLKQLIDEKIDFKQIEQNIIEGELESLSCAAFSYNQQRTVSFVDSKAEQPGWSLQKKYSSHGPLRARHILASCAIPILFPPVKINQEYFGDGNLRNTTPLSSLIRLGADRILIVGVRTRAIDSKPNFIGKPSIGQIAGIILNGMFFDATDIDVERLGHINNLLSQTTMENLEGMRPIKIMWVEPSVDLGNIARDINSVGLPSPIRYLLGGLGSRNEVGEIESYLMFHGTYTKKLIALGYSDAISLKNQLMDFLGDESC